jgi:hypothetical protein
MQTSLFSRHAKCALFFLCAHHRVAFFRCERGKGVEKSGEEGRGKRKKEGGEREKTRTTRESERTRTKKEKGPASKL